MSELPSGTVTFLFTDLEVSTRLWDQEPEAMRAALARHDELLREAVASRGGQVVKGRGDGVHAVFATADGAVRAAIDCALAMDAERWAVREPLRARIGCDPRPRSFAGRLFAPIPRSLSRGDPLCLRSVSRPSSVRSSARALPAVPAGRVACPPSSTGTDRKPATCRFPSMS